MARVLVVDDETAISLLLEYYLGSVGHAVTSARSPLGSLSWLDMEEFDVVVMDVMMPGPMNGLDVCRVLKEDPRTSGTRVLIISGVPDVESRAVAAGADAFLQKPFHLDEIGKFVDTLAEVKPRAGATCPGSLERAIQAYDHMTADAM
jgi:DNA-binding response OmpR family regulator